MPHVGAIKRKDLIYYLMSIISIIRGSITHHVMEKALLTLTCCAEMSMNGEGYIPKPPRKREID